MISQYVLFAYWFTVSVSAFMVICYVAWLLNEFLDDCKDRGSK
jgi:hypothetical protein